MTYKKRLKVVKAFQLTIVLALSVGAGGVRSQTVRFDSGDALFSSLEGVPTKAACQPLRGETAEVSGAPRAVFGTQVLPLRVSSGRCQGTTGWAGIPRLAAADVAAAPSAESGGVRFSESDSLFKTKNPGDGKTACQPLKGDVAQIVETAEAFGTTLAHVRVLSGRCKDTNGWAGTPRLESAATPRQ